jgi:hypothetical protein
MTQQPNLLPLKILVVILGIFLIGGMIFLFTAIANKAGEVSDLKCTDAKLDLQGKGAVTNITPQGSTVQITLANPHQTMLLTIDRCSGKTLQTLTIEH